MSLIFKVTNPGGTIPIWPQPSGWKLDRYFDKGGTLQLDIAGSHGIADRAIVEAYYADEEGADSYSDIPFRGFVLPSDDRGDEVSKITIPSIEKMLDYRYTQLSRWPAGTTLAKILASDWPGAGETPGYLCQANNLIQPGSFVLLSGNVWKLPQGGTSFLGSLHTLGDRVYIDSTQQSWGTSTSLSSGQYWQDADYLYIHSTKNPYYSVVLAEGSYETNIRLGTISLASSTFTRSWRSAGAMISKEIARLLLAFELEFQYVHNADGYTYLNASAAIGRGANSTYYPTYKYDEVEIIRVRRNTTGGNAPVHALRGLGIGRGASRQAYSEASFPAGLRFVVLEEYSNQFAEQLAGTVSKKYADMQDQTAWQIVAEDDPTVMPGDYVRIEPEEDAPTIERIKQISESSNGPMNLYLGQRPRDLEDVARAKLDLRDALQRDLDLQFSAISVSNQENVDSSTPANIILDVPADDWDDELDSSWLMSIKMTAFESSVTGGTVAASYHGTAGNETYTGSAGAHQDHDLADAGDVGEPDGPGIYTFILNDDVTDSSGGTTHDHDLDGSWGTIPPYIHGHYFDDGSYPGTADEHEDHYLDLNPARTASVIQAKNIKDGFGSLAYLTVTATVINSLYPSGVTVPGTPYYDVAINETIEDLDVRGLVVPGQNTIRISIVKYGGTGNVAARANVSLSGKVVLKY
jgi:hypothetical protein